MIPKTKSKMFYVSILLVGFLGIFNVYLLSSNPGAGVKDNFKGLSGTVTVAIDGVTVVQQDSINPISYDYIACMVWQTGCGSLTGSGNNLIFPQPLTYTTTATISSIYPAMTYLGALDLSSGTQTSNVCTNVLSTNGMNETVATITHSGQVNTPIVTLTASWTATSTISAIQSVCLTPATSNLYVSQFKNAPSEGTSNPTDYAYENFASQSLSSGQSITITWQFNM